MIVILPFWPCRLWFNLSLTLAAHQISSLERSVSAAHKQLDSSSSTEDAALDNLKADKCTVLPRIKGHGFINEVALVFGYEAMTLYMKKKADHAMFI